ncbi:MAG TPA: RDD family protein [Actinomycetota bacterium]|nr:RDD family protein [Actinomycetota bacterium]
MTPSPDSDHGLRGVVRRAADGAREAADSAFDATVGRVGQSVGEAALEATNATAQQVIEDLEPYLIEEAIPRIVAGIMPYLTEDVVPEVLAGITDHLTTVTIPDVVDGVSGHLVEVTVPEVVAGVTPRLVEDLLPRLLTDLQPYLEQQLVPQIVDGLLPYLETAIAPRLIDSLMPKLADDVAPQLVNDLMPMITATVAPQLVDALMPKIRDQVAPDLLDALMPKIENEIAPQLVDSLMPKIRGEVVPLILDDIVDDPRVRDLIREQSQGLFLDALEGFRSALADLDSLVDGVGRRLLRRPARLEPETALQLVLADSSPEDTRPLRLAVEDLAKQRAAWRALPAPPAPPGRAFTYAGAITRLLGLAIDLFVVGYLSTVLFSTLASLIDSLFAGAPPQWLSATFVVLAAMVIPVYLGLCYWILGRSLGMGIVGIRVCTPDGRRPGLIRAMARGWLGMLGLGFWLATGVVVFFDSKRRGLLDRLAHTEVRYSVPETQQRRHVRDAVQEQRDAAGTHGQTHGQGPDTLSRG